MGNSKKSESPWNRWNQCFCHLQKGFRFSILLSFFLAMTMSYNVINGQCQNYWGSYPSEFGTDVFFDDEKWLASYDDCTGTLTVYVKIGAGHPTGQFAIGTMYNMSLKIIKEDATELEIFRLNRDSSPGNLGVSCSEVLISPPYNNRFYYSGISHTRITPLRALPLSGNYAYGLKIEFQNLPTDLFNTTSQVELTPDWRQAINGGGSGSYGTKGTRSITQRGVGSGHNYNLSATMDGSCDHVELNWTNPTPVANCSRNYTDIHRRVKGSGGTFEYVGRVQFPSTSYNDIVPKGIEYEYQVRHLWFPNDYRWQWASFSGTATGSRKGALPIPSDFSATDDDCDDRTLLTWNWPNPTTDLEDFLIQRRLQGATTWQDLDNVPSTLRSYDDETADYDKIYEYRIFSRNNCSPSDISVASPVVEGLRPGPPIEPDVTSVDVVSGGIQINWTVEPNTINTGFVIERTVPGGGSALIIQDIAATATSYTDRNVKQCVTYTYRVKATSLCYPDGSGSDELSNIIKPDLSNSFTTDGQGFRASKGYFSDKVELNWLNQNEGLTNTVKIFRRILGSGDPFTLLTTLNGGSGIYNDLSAASGELYEYQVLAEGPCENGVIQSNLVESIGFRRKTGIINGNVSYEGGVAVENVKIIAGDPTNVTFPSLQFAVTDTAIIEHSTALELDDQLVVEAWIKPLDYHQDFTLVSKEGSFELAYEQSISSYKFNVISTTGTHVVSLHQDSLGIGNWVHLAGSFANNQLQLLVDGSPKAVSHIPTLGDIVDTTNPLLIGPGLHGKMKEFRLWNVEKDSIEFVQDYSRFLAGNETGLKVYLNAGEGRGDYAYDLSRSGSLFNKHHAKLTGSSRWDAVDSPSANQLSISAYTDVNGNYNMVIPYGGSGQNFIITPILNIHQFDPSTKSVFIGDGNPIENGVDFIDISAFRVTGQVLFDGMTCPSKEVFVKIDGEVVIENGVPIRTDVDGKFEMDVPIGNHVITLEKNGHEFSAGRFPITGEHNFQAPISGIEFKDSTLRKVVGRVVGGTHEGDKVPGLGRSKNNIGIANLTFDPTLTCAWVIDEANGITRPDTSVLTDSLTGEYMISLPPLDYLVKDVSVLQNPGVDLGPALILDLTSVPFPQEITDTVFQEGTDNIIAIETLSYHKQWDYVYRSAPEIDVMNQSKNGPLTGDDTFIYQNQKFGNDTISIPATMLPYPVFTQNKRYNAVISTYESYVNKDSGTDIEDRVPVTDGILTITNELATTEKLIIDFDRAPNYVGDTLYTFIAGQANIAENIIIPEYSFTKPFKVDLKVGAQAASWEPISGAIPPGGNRFYRAYIMGAKDVEQSDFVTQGPSIVSYILRDPPGSQSSATRSIGQTTTNEINFSASLGVGASGSKGVIGGLQFESGIGYTTETNADFDVTVGFESSLVATLGGVLTESVTNTQEWSTSSDPLFAGAESDLFIGASSNYIFGEVTSLIIVDTALCNLSTAINCFGNPMNKYSLALEESIALGQGDIQTTFIFTRNKIKTDEIPDLQNLRNNFLSNNPNYTSNLAIDHPCYGYNNDDPRFGTPACPNTMGPSNPYPLSAQESDLDGPSYILLRPSDLYIDTIRNYNQQIRLWEEALAIDEAQKANVSNGQNFSYGGGGASFSNSVSESVSTEFNWNIEFQLTKSLVTQFGFESGGVGFDNEIGLSINRGVQAGGTETTETTHEVSYTISDDSEWDDFTFDVYPPSNGGGPIFKTLAGRTSCPWEGPVYSEYYNPGTLLNPGTIKLEDPEISISPSVLYNVPQDEAAVFTMTLTNNNIVGEGWEFATKLLGETNPNSAGVSVGNSDDLTREWVIPAQSSITRDIFVEIGTVYDYEDLTVALHSTCQFQQGLSEEEDIVDYATFNVHFIPECTDIGLSNPEDNWVLNNSFGNQLDIVADGYDINYLNLDNLSIEYKPSNENNWIQLEKYYYDTTGMNDPEVLQIDRTNPFSTFRWDVEQIPDGPYDLRAASDCTVTTTESPIYSGYMDRINPHAFGSPSPADGILDADEDIIIQFNEDIDIGTVSDFNIDVRGVLNGTPFGQETSLAFDGVNDFGEIPEYQLQKRSLTIEMWLKRNVLGEQVIISQGGSASDQLMLSFAADGKLTLQLGDQIATSDGAITDQDWHHVAVSYDRESGAVSFLIDNTLVGSLSNFLSDYTGTGLIYIGKDAADNIAAFSGQLLELRLWDGARTLAQIAPKSAITMSGREDGLIGNWSMNEAHGALAHDKVRSRHMLIYGGTWSIAPASHAYAFTGSNYLKADNTGTLAFSAESDITIEGWVKTAGGSNMSILSNGIPSVNQSSFWNIYLNGSGNLVIANDGNEVSTSTTMADDNWHHFAIVLERTKSLTIYVDGDLVMTDNASLFEDFGSGALYLGALGNLISGTETVTNHFIGSLDDIRVWNVARKPAQISRDFIIQLNGDEPGLMAYYPFDDYRVELGVPLLDETLADVSDSDFDLSALGVVGAYTLNAPTMRLPRPISKVNYTFSINGDRMVIEPSDPPNRIENVTLDITVKGIRDLAGNFMESPETWIAYIDQNQVFWETEYLSFEKDLEDDLTFTAKIKNTGGGQEQFNLSNLPSWLSAAPSSGLIDPNSEIEITFTVQSLLNIGSYEQDIFVSTESFGFNERLLLDLKVNVKPPEWTIDPEAFSFGMNITGQLKLNDVISTDPEDMVSVWINDELRGVSHVEYDESSGKNLVFLTVLSNVSGGELIEFRVWDASLGRLLKGVLPDNLTFLNNQILGSRGNPLDIEATVLTQLTYELNSGWNWISFPLASSILSDVNSTLAELSPSDNDQLKYPGEEHIYAGGSWRGFGDFDTERGFKIKLAEPDTFRYEGTFIDPSTEPIEISAGWNWIGLKSEFIVDVATAMSSLDPETGAVIKGQRSFALYEEGFGWGGNLDFLRPQEGYMLYYHKQDELLYQGSGGSNLTVKQDQVIAKSSKGYKSNASHALAGAYNYVEGIYSSNMSLTAEIDACVSLDNLEQELELSSWSLVAFDLSGNCRGIQSATWIPNLDKYLYYLSIDGSAPEALTFKLIHNIDKIEISLSEVLEFGSNAVIGSSLSPYAFSCKELGDCAKSSMMYRTEDVDMDQMEIQQQVLSTLTTDAILPSGRKFIFKAGNSIEFISGFEVPKLSILEAFIEDCIQTQH